MMVKSFVLGGLIEQSQNTVSRKVPIAGDLPVVGNLFKSENTDNLRTNLMVFIRPTIVRDREDARSVTQRSYRYIRAEELLNEDVDGERMSELDAFFSDVLGTEIPNE